MRIAVLYGILCSAYLVGLLATLSGAVNWVGLSFLSALALAGLGMIGECQRWRVILGFGALFAFSCFMLFVDGSSSQWGGAAMLSAFSFAMSIFMDY